MKYCRECGDLYEAWRDVCPNSSNHLTDEQKEWVAAMVPDESQCIGWIQ